MERVIGEYSIIKSGGGRGDGTNKESMLRERSLECPWPIVHFHGKPCAAITEQGDQLWLSLQVRW